MGGPGSGGQLNSGRPPDLAAAAVGGGITVDPAAAQATLAELPKPEGLSEHASGVWDIAIEDIMKLKLHREQDVMAIRAWVEAWGDYFYFREQFDAAKLIDPSGMGTRRIGANMREAQAMALRIGGEQGFGSPLARIRTGNTGSGGGGAGGLLGQIPQFTDADGTGGVDDGPGQLGTGA